MSTCSAAKIQDTELLGGWHNAIPSENAEAKHEARLLLRVTWKPKRILNPKTDDSETNLRESEIDHGESNNNQTINISYCLHSVTGTTISLLCKSGGLGAHVLSRRQQPQFPDVHSLRKSKISTSCCFRLVHLRQFAEQQCHFPWKLPKSRHEHSSTCPNLKLK